MIKSPPKDKGKTLEKYLIKGGNESLEKTTKGRKRKRKVIIVIIVIV